MKILRKAIFAILVTSNYVAAQNSFDTLDINNIHAVFNASGDMLYRINTGGWYVSAPGNEISYSIANLWIGGIDNNGTLNLAAQTYRQSGTDFWPGPIDTIGLYCPIGESVFYNYVWNVSCAEVDSFIAASQGPIPGFTIPQDIQTWPGNGNSVYNESHYIASFIDVDGDGLYQCLAGDYPLVRGSQSLFYVYNDALENSTHTQSGASAMNLQIEAMPYAYNYPWSEALMNTIFVHYSITNYSTSSYTGTYIGLWSDINFSSYDGAASDSLTGTVYHYDPNNAVALYLLSDTAAGAIAYVNNFTMNGNPQTPDDYYELLSRRWSPNNVLTYGGTGINTGAPTQWAYTGNPVTNTGWISSPPWHNRILLSTDSFTFAPGTTREFVIAMSFAYDTTAPYASFTKANQYVSFVRQFYAGNNGYCSPTLSSISETEVNTPGVYPNPAANSVTISSTSPVEMYSVIDVDGHVVLRGMVTSRTFQLDISSLSSGVYLLQLTTDKEITTTRFVKMQ